MTSGEWKAGLNPFTFDQRLYSVECGWIWGEKGVPALEWELQCLSYPLTVRQSGFKIIWVRDVTTNVESRPLPPWIKHGLPSWSKHWATTHAAFSEFNTSVSQFEWSSRLSHLSVEHVVSLQAENIKELHNVYDCFTLLRRFSVKVGYLLWVSRSCPIYSTRVKDCQLNGSPFAIGYNADQFHCSIYPYSMYLW